MDIEKLSPTELKQYFHDCWEVPQSSLPMVEYSFFGQGKEFLLHGVMGLHTVFMFLSYGVLTVTQINIDPYWDEFDVLALKPNFSALCEAYTPPDDLPNFGTYCEYDHPSDMLLDDDTVIDDKFLKDYRGAGVFMFSERRLRSEIKTNAREWIEYRTPYRLESFNEF